MYPPGFDSFVDVGAVAEPWEGAARPGHFRGVATVVLKLFQLVPADRAYFGRKDYQQTLVVERLVADFHVPTDDSRVPDRARRRWTGAQLAQRVSEPPTSGGGRWRCSRVAASWPKRRTRRAKRPPKRLRRRC